MKQSKPYLWPIWVLGAVAAFRIFFTIYTFYALQWSDFKGTGDFPIRFQTFFFIFLWPVLPIIEVVIYWKLRFRLENRFWVHAHIWCIFIALGLFPILVTILNQLSIRLQNPEDHYSFYSLIVQVQFYAFWFLMGIGHVFFIGTIVKSFSKKQETISDEQATGLLDEFAE